MARTANTFRVSDGGQQEMASCQSPDTIFYYYATEALPGKLFENEYEESLQRLKKGRTFCIKKY